MAPSTYRAETIDGRTFRIVAGSDGGARTRAHAIGAVKLARLARAGRTIEVSIDARARAEIGHDHV